MPAKRHTNHNYGRTVATMVVIIPTATTMMVTFSSVAVVISNPAMVMVIAPTALITLTMFCAVISTMTCTNGTGQ